MNKAKNLVFVAAGEPMPTPAQVEEIARNKGRETEFVVVKDGAEAWDFLTRRDTPAQIFYTVGISPTFWEFFDRDAVTLLGGAFA